MEGRPRFCAELDGNIGKLIFGHIKLVTTRRICRAVCKAWRQMQRTMQGAWQLVRMLQFEYHVMQLEDQHMGVLRFWMRVYRDKLCGEDQQSLVFLSVKQDKPTALRLFLTHTDRKPDAMILRTMEMAIVSNARNCIQDVLLPAAVLAGREAALSLGMLIDAPYELFEWFAKRFPLKFPDASGIKLNGKTPRDLEAKLQWMGQHAELGLMWWRAWFRATAGIRHRWTNSKGKQMYVEPADDEHRMYNADVAVAIVQHVLKSIPEDAVTFLTYRKLRNTRERDDALYTRLAACRNLSIMAPRPAKKAKVGDGDDNK
jgi:hypothetical protein